MAASLGLALVPWGVLGAGILTGKPASERRWPERPCQREDGAGGGALRSIAAAHGATPAQVAIAWLLGAGGPPTIVPIVGARTEAQIVENLGALQLELTAEERGELDEAGAPELGFPRSFLESENVRGLIYGETWERLEAVAR